VEEVRELGSIFNLLCNATGMEINMRKSSIYFSRVN
jgi:hypothetical protein